MYKDYVRNEIEHIDDDVLLSIIECCKQLAINGVPLYEWNNDRLLEVFDELFNEKNITLIWENWFISRKTLK